MLFRSGFFQTTSNLQSRQGFLYSDGASTTINVPGSYYTEAFGINSNGQIVGNFRNSTGVHGFFYSDGSFTQLDAPGASDTVANGLNDEGQIVGNFVADGVAHGFLYRGGSFIQLDVPGAILGSTAVFGINKAGEMVGAFVAPDFSDHGFLYTQGNFTQFDVPGAVNTVPRAINDARQIVGNFVNSRGLSLGFLADPLGLFAGAPGKANCLDQTVSALVQQYGTMTAAVEALGYPGMGALQNAITAYCHGSDRADSTFW